MRIVQRYIFENISDTIGAVRYMNNNNISYSIYTCKDVVLDLHSDLGSDDVLMRLFKDGGAKLRY
jgi:hypothetical protein